MPSQYKRPSCGAAIPLDDANVAKDVALCGACAKEWAFGTMLKDEPKQLKQFIAAAIVMRVSEGR